ncbi:uncharacterized protein Dyak_GE27557 [Drosophila yakuba]|uniref:BED-type domain-containing protein n=1 Tax=Drosophila yakuba TaxID=7245 RepID=A0A0R1DN45_DROYA|nr:uncharacterized protein Dyak_GE27557 [Drosophila yakuba]
MGREQNKKVHFFFKLNPADNKSKCNVCGVKLAGSHATNLKRHLIAKHADVFNEFEIDDEIQQNMKKRKISYETSEESIVSSIIKIVTTDGKPLLFLDSEGFRQILNPIYNALSMNPITSRNVMEYVTVKEQTIKENIRALVKGKLVSLKIDVATRMDKAILGVNLQMIQSTMSKAEIVIKTLGMIQLRHSHTGMYIKEKVIEIINDYGITLDQIFSITSDNGKNMTKAIQILNDDSESFLDDDTHDDINGENVMDKLDTIQLANIHLVRCAAHTLQLCVIDINKLDEISEKVSSCRKICKLLRTETNRCIPQHKVRHHARVISKTLRRS